MRFQARHAVDLLGGRVDGDSQLKNLIAGRMTKGSLTTLERLGR